MNLPQWTTAISSVYILYNSSQCLTYRKRNGAGMFTVF